MITLQLDADSKDRLDYLAPLIVRSLLHKESKEQVLNLEPWGIGVHTTYHGWIRQIPLAKVWHTKTKGIQVKSLSDLFAQDSLICQYFIEQISSVAAQEFKAMQNSP